MKNKSAFTLAEVMITMALLGILSSILLSAVATVRPNDSKALFKKAYYVAERMVSELVNDEALYPEGDGTAVGLDNASAITYGGVVYSDDTKFCKLFAVKVNTISNSVNCTVASQEPTSTNEPSFVTSDGIAWYMPISKFPSDQHITVDVNGEKRPNCKFSSNCPKPDRFEIYIQPDGKMYVSGTKEKEYLSSNKSMH